MEETSQFHTVRGYQLMEKNENLLTSSMEDYLEMIYRNSLTSGYLRINTLSELLNVAAPSATKMVQKLARLGFLDYKKYGIVFMTETGKEVGKYLLHRHEIIQNFLIHLGVNTNVLLETELIEHNISITTLQKINAFNDFINCNPDVETRYAQYRENIPQKQV